MTAEADICNLALYRLRQKQRVAAVPDTNTQTGRDCTFLYPVVRDRLLAGYPWNWATRVQALALDTEAPPPGWLYAYAYPVGCLKLRAITDAAGSRVWREDFESGRVFRRPRIPYELGSNSAGERVILTDVAEAYGVMVWRITHPDQFGPLFGDFLAWALAADLMGALNVDRAVVQTVMAALPVAQNAARAHAGNERQQDPPQDSPSITCRD